MLANGCSACRCVLPVVCLHFSLFNLGSLVCESQLPSLLIRASPLNMSACYNVGRVVIFYPNYNWVVFFGGGFVAMLSLPEARRQLVSMTEGETEKKKEVKWRGNVLTGGEDRDSFLLIESLHHHTVACSRAYAHSWLVWGWSHMLAC